MADEFPGLTIITVTRNRPDGLRRCLTRTRNVFPDVPIVVYDDASDLPAAVNSAVADLGMVRVLRGTSCLGPAGGRNICIEHANTPFCLSLDDDCYLNDVGGLQEWFYERPKYNNVGVVCFQVRRTHDNVLSPSNNRKSGEILSFHGGASLLKRSVFQAVGGYRTLLRFGGEDTELARRIWLSGYQVWYDASVQVQHEHNPLGRRKLLNSYYYIRNQLIIEALTGHPFWGLPTGIVKALRKGIFDRRPLATPVAIMMGVALTLIHWRERTPLPVSVRKKLATLA
ncbi:MAG: glycosyltransferase family 2 protein [Anaerolineae bacterium]|nr:glycosyltransferase family 2 protein [Anaerolineae bacterium]